MTEDKKEGGFNGKWAVVTVHPRLPSHTEQIARARAWGVNESMLGAHDVSAMVIEDVRHVTRTTNWKAKLPLRFEFIHHMQILKPKGHTVFFATPLCVGFSAKVAEETMRGFWAAGMGVYVHSVRDNGSAIYQDGDDLTEFLDMIDKAQNAAHQRGWRGRKS